MKQEIDEELRFHVEQRTAENIAAGMSREDAEREARKRFGNMQSVREECRDERGANFGEAVWQDLRFGCRQLVKHPGFTIVAVLTLALGIGATTGIFSVVYATLFEPLPYHKPDQLVMVWSQIKQARNSVSVGDYLEWKRRSTSFQYLEAFSGSTFNVGTDDRPQQIRAALLTPGFFRMHGTPMLLGRDFLPEEGEFGKDRVAIVSHRFWSQHFGADREIIGRQIRMNGDPYTVIGVARPGLDDRRPAQMWLPLAFKPDQINHQARWISVMGRLKDGVTIQQANAEMRAIAQQLAEEHPQSNANCGVSVEPLQNNFIPEKTINNLWLLLGAVGFLLLIGCVNIANLLLVRGTTRHREVAIRTALGATRARVFGQFLVESVVLALVGGALGIWLARLVVDGILALLPPNMLPSEAHVRISVPVLVFAVLATLFAGVISGCVPAWKASRLDLNEVLKLGGRTGQGGGGRGLRRALVVVEFALALTLLAGGGLAVRSFWNLTQVDLGIRTDHVLTFYLPVPQNRFADTERINPYYQQLLEKLESVPGVERATVTTWLPLTGIFRGQTFRIAGAPPPDPAALPDARLQMVTAGYFDTFGIRMIQGRHFNEQDRAGSQRVAMVNESFLKEYLSAADPLTQRILMNQFIPGTTQTGPEEEWQIVGVFHDTRGGDALRSDNVPVIYVPFWQNPRPRASVAVRTKGDPELITRSLAMAVNAVDPDLPLAGVKTMDQILAESLSYDRFGMVLYGSFAVLALLLASIGIYGVMAFAVAQRTHEFGIRMALGATEGQILGLILREGVTLALCGLALGLGGAYLVGRATQSTLFGVSALDVQAFSAVGAVLVAAALLASYVPARRASRVDPMVALRTE